MHAHPIISSLQNPKIKRLIRLKKARERKTEQRTVVEGLRELERAIESRAVFDEFYYCDTYCTSEYLQRYKNYCIKTGIALYPCSKTVFEKISYREHPEGILGVAHIPPLALDELTLSDTPLLLVAEGIEKPGNLGTLLRTADATGADAVILIDNRTDITNPNVIRASIGSLFFVPLIETKAAPFLAWCRDKQIQTIAALPEANADYTTADLHRPTALFVGAEANGLTPSLLKEIQQQVTIPMAGKNDSLNVSTAAAYEAIRQRNRS